MSTTSTALLPRFSKLLYFTSQIQYGSVADEYCATHPAQISIEPGDILVEIDGQPICPNSMLFQQQRQKRMSKIEALKEDWAAKRKENLIYGDDGEAKVKQVRRAILDYDPDRDDAPRAVVHEDPFADAPSPDQQKKGGRRGSYDGNFDTDEVHVAFNEYILSPITRLDAASNRFGYKHEDAFSTKPAEMLAHDFEAMYKRLDVVNKELFDVFYHAPSVKLRFMRLQPPQQDRGQGFGYVINLVRPPGGRVKRKWGLEFYLDWEPVDSNAANRKKLGTGESSSGQGSEDGAADRSGQRGKGALSGSGSEGTRSDDPFGDPMGRGARTNMEAQLALLEQEQARSSGGFSGTRGVIGQNIDFSATTISASTDENWMEGGGPKVPSANELFFQTEADLKLKRVIKVHAVEVPSVANDWNEQDPDLAIMPGDKLLSIQGMAVQDITWDFLTLPPLPEMTVTDKLPAIQEDGGALVASGGGSPGGADDEDAPTSAWGLKINAWKGEVLNQFTEHKVLAQVFELVFEEIEHTTHYPGVQQQPQPVIRTYLKSKGDRLFGRDLELEAEFWRYDPDSVVKTTKSGFRSPRRILEKIETTDDGGLEGFGGLPLPTTQPPESPRSQMAVSPGTDDERREEALEVAAEVYTYEPPPVLDIPESLARANFKVFLTRKDVSFPWGIYLDERFANLNIYVVQELEESLDAPVNMWNAYADEIGAYGCQLQLGDIIVAFNEQHEWKEAEKEM